VIGLDVPTFVEPEPSHRPRLTRHDDHLLDTSFGLESSLSHDSSWGDSLSTTIAVLGPNELVVPGDRIPGPAP
jgi:hypothetical protein